MPEPSTFLTFCLATVAVLLIPGPSVAYVVSCSLEHGRKAGLWSVLGLETGALLHVVGAAFGVGAVLASSPGLFGCVKAAGACYLLGLGIAQFLRRDVTQSQPRHRAESSSSLRIFRDGVLVDLLNPKTVLFFLAFLPQFVQPGSGPLQILVLGGYFVLLAAACDAAYAVAAGGFATRVRRSVRTRRWIAKVTGGVYVGLAGVAVLA
ncbi:threonine/homoserine/homoserine lactone efflux protein [Kribbella amoyensis]|uniref:Threonine/homoserine/homoserine lactone efflux protein n=1 Tax=Kribbella amoyensis TaxID=996641 RepID=A0A561C0T1_9ACTN|nr:LysE family translocator [Kribbella amoyensis]TWD84755.1 threonine/homoserine/homoserine lactone efflux protein [Kribbella amoyensis]